jgi:hypothetical protein
MHRMTSFLTNNRMSNRVFQVARVANRFVQSYFNATIGGGISYLKFIFGNCIDWVEGGNGGILPGSEFISNTFCNQLSIVLGQVQIQGFEGGMTVSLLLLEEEEEEFIVIIGTTAEDDEEDTTDETLLSLSSSGDPQTQRQFLSIPSLSLTLRPYSCNFVITVEEFPLIVCTLDNVR